ncbi:MAG TPA: preprotein translocase subunit YajC, partial [Aequorivita sp.]|nr:preprotein translocase subunit YajC [Aequorivita sp.]
LELYEDGTCLIECGAGKIKFERAAISMERTAKLNAPVKEKK